MKYQFMPMFWGDFLANTMHFTAQEVGAYLLLIAHAWEHGGKIPVKDLQRVARVGNNHWYQVRARLEPFFTATTGVEMTPTTGVVHWVPTNVCVRELTQDGRNLQQTQGRSSANAQQKHEQMALQMLHPPYYTTTTYRDAF